MLSVERAWYSLFDRPGEHEHIARWRDRCTYCGHRVAVGGVAPIETRSQPWRIPSEIVHRFVAMGLDKASL